VRDGILGAMVGFVLGLLAAFGRESLDRRLRNARELHDELGAPVLTRVPASAFGAAGLIANGKPPMAETDFEAFRVLRMNLASIGAEGPPRSLLVTSAMAEEGKTTVSLALACASTVAGKRTLLVECDLRRPTLAKRLPLEREPGLSDYLLERATPQEILQTVELSPPSGANGGERIEAPSGSLVCITAGSPVSNPAELLVSPRFHQFLDRVSEAYDLVVLDGGPLLSIVDPLQLVPRVEGVLFCVRAQRTTRDQVRAARVALANLPRRPVGAVLTGLKRRGPDAYDYHYGY
jgi:receptor protein-tyrosine kinase